MSKERFLIERTAVGRLPSGESCAEFKLSEVAVQLIMDALLELQPYGDKAYKEAVGELIRAMEDATNEFPVEAP